MYQIELRFNDQWVVIGRDFVSTDAANWTIGQWKQANECHGDRCFRIVAQ